MTRHFSTAAAVAALLASTAAFAQAEQMFNRIAAFVVNLTPDWSADLGGLLMFTGADGHLEEAFTPKFNTLSLFRVPQPHAVSAVAPFARGARLAVTGWLRRGPPPA